MEAINLVKSTKPSNIIASIPHGSSSINSEMRAMMRDEVLLTNNDWFLNELFNFLKELNITTVSANYSRYLIDVNRDIGKKEIDGDYTESLIYGKTTFGKEIYKGAIPSEAVVERIKNFYEPYHLSLSGEIDSCLKASNKAYLFDLHSFYAQSDADVVLGTKNGTTCSKEFFGVVYNAFVSEGFSVKVDEIGLRGGHIVTHYSKVECVEAIQIELRYTSYIEDRYFGEEEVTCKDVELFGSTKQRLKRVFENIVRSFKLMD